MRTITLVLSLFLIGSLPQSYAQRYIAWGVEHTLVEPAIVPSNVLGGITMDLLIKDFAD